MWFIINTQFLATKGIWNWSVMWTNYCRFYNFPHLNHINFCHQVFGHIESNWQIPYVKKDPLTHEGIHDTSTLPFVSPWSPPSILWGWPFPSRRWRKYNINNKRWKMDFLNKLSFDSFWFFMFSSPNPKNITPYWNLGTIDYMATLGLPSPSLKHLPKLKGLFVVPMWPSTH